MDYVDGTLSIQWLKVARIQSRQLFIVQAQNGSLYTGTIASAPGEANKIRIGENDRNAAAVVEQSEIVALEETSVSFLRSLSGDINLGAVYSKGNNATQYNLGASVEYQQERWGVQADLSSSLSANTGSETSTRNQVNLNGYRRLPWNNFYYGGLASFLQSSVQDIQLQKTLGGGIGRYFKNTNRARISFLAGLTWRSTDYEASTLGAATQDAVAGLITGEFRFFVFKKANFSVKAYLIPSLTDAGRVYFNTDASQYLKLFKNFSWTVSFYGSWDTRPPASLSGSDYGYSTGVAWTFGYR